MGNVLLAFVCFGGIGLVFGVLLAYASKAFAVKSNPRVEKIASCLPGANCGGCGYTSCHALAVAIEKGVAKTNSCRAVNEETIKKISDIMGVEAEKTVRMRAQVMCSGTFDRVRSKYIYEGPRDCAAVVKLGGGNKLCLNGCIGYGTCVAKCNFDAIKVVDGVAHIDYDKCTGCGSCVSACPKHIIKLIPYHSAYWVGCMSVDNGKMTMKNCDIGCIGCRLCERGCEAGAIKIENFVASIDYNKCTGCGACVAKCPRHIIRTGNLAIHEKKVLENALKKGR
ncbi:MAG: RnfABCDGE type electron transport complex subunit B [Ruminococcaceae bacterium]|nr:RnfABCDGE type electron transport complex subunit B [Oscillospiraceae bacterium]